MIQEKEIEYKLKKWFRASPLRNGIIFSRLNSISEKRLEFELLEDDILSIRGEIGNQYLAYTETGLMMIGYVNKSDVRKLSEEESKKVNLVMVPPYISAKY